MRMHQVMDEIMAKAEVVCCTAIGAGASKLDRGAFTRVLLDEASQATEFCSIVPFCPARRGRSLTA